MLIVVEYPPFNLMAENISKTVPQGTSPRDLSKIINNKDRFRFKYNESTKVIRFPVETCLFPFELVDYSRLIPQFEAWLREMVPKSPYTPFKTCSMVNGLVKSGKTIACTHIFPAVAVGFFPTALFGYIDLQCEGVYIGCDYITAATILRNAIRNYVVSLGIVLKKSEIDRGINADINSCIEAACNFPQINFLVIDELQRLFQTSGGQGMHTIFKAIVNQTRASTSKLRIIFTGSGLVRAWNEILKCTSNNYPPYANISLIQISSHCEEPDLKTARDIFQKHYPDIPPEIIDNGISNNPAAISFFAETWFRESSNDEGKQLERNDRIQNALHRVEQKFKNEFLADVHPLLREFPVQHRKVLFRLSQGTSENPQESLGTFYNVLRPFIQAGADAETRKLWKFYPSYLSFFVGQYVDANGRLIDNEVSPYLLTYYYKYESLLQLTQLGENVTTQNRTALAVEVEEIFRKHFETCGERIDKTTYDQHKLFQFLLDHEKNSLAKIDFKSINHDDFQFYYCYMLVMLRNVISHLLPELEKLKHDIDQISIPQLHHLRQQLKASPVIREHLSSLRI